jgi:aspartate 4-decarboxylase
MRRKELIRKRYQTLYSHNGRQRRLREPNDVNYYSLIDLQEIGGTLYGPEFKAWFIKERSWH